jgi:hypothetical protein
MNRHMFKVGQTLDLIPDRDEAHVPPGAYTIERLLPIEGRTAMYRVRHSKDGHTRVLREAQLAKPNGSA